MTAKTLFLPILFVAIGIATYWFYSQSIISANSDDTRSNQPEAAVSTPTQETKEARTEGNKEASSSQDIPIKASDESLHELKNSIQGVIADSIQDEIQEAVENKIIKTDGVQQ